jgi:hypothetical protein
MKYSVKKFNGDDSYSYAVFRAADVRGIRSPVMWGQATPVVSGCSRMEANSYKKRFEAEARA